MRVDVTSCYILYLERYYQLRYSLFTMILDDIVATKKTEVEALKKRTSVDELKAVIAYLPMARDFRGAIKNPVSLIAEIKKASPSEGVICEEFKHLSLAKEYANSGASAISVLTDEKYFQGALKYLSDVSSFAGIPVLRKDFLIDELQIYESRANGADAVLLIAAILDDGKLASMIKLSDGLGMRPLVEVRDIAELKRAVAAGAAVIGINNRDLKTFKVDIETTFNLLKEIPEDITIVSESGFKTRDQIDRLKAAGVNAVLIGTELMRAKHPGQKIRELVG